MALVRACGGWHCCQPQFIPCSKDLGAPRSFHVQKRLGFRVFQRQGTAVVRLFHRIPTSREGRIGGSRLSIPTSTVSGLKLRGRAAAFFAESESGSEVSDEGQTEEERPPFHLDLAVLLGGFAFESYNTPAKDVGVHEMDGGGCETVYLTTDFFQAVYNGQLFVKLNKGIQFPGLDLWGSSDPYVVFSIGDCSVRSRTIWANRDPVWNEDLTLNIKTSAGQDLKVAAWDANLVTAHRRLGNSSVSLRDICDGKRHDLELKLEGMGGGGKLFFEVQFKTFAEIEAEKGQFTLAGLFSGEYLANAYRSIFGTSDISVGKFMEHYQSNRNTKIDLSNPSNAPLKYTETANVSAKEDSQRLQTKQSGLSDMGLTTPTPSLKSKGVEGGTSVEPKDSLSGKEGGKKDEDGEVEVWRKLAESLSQTLKPLGVDMSGFLMDRDTWEVSEDVKSLGLEAQKKAEAQYAESGLAVVEGEIVGESGASNPTASSSSSETGKGLGLDPLPAEQQALRGLMKQTEGIVGMWAMFNKSLGGNPSDGQEGTLARESGEGSTAGPSAQVVEVKVEKQEKGEMEHEETRTTMFSTAESAMEAWAVLATTMGGSSLVKSDFEKIGFIENERTDTQVAIWRDSSRQRLVVAFRGTEQTKWKDVVTDLSLLATGFNPERVADWDSVKDEALVHSGFLKAYDSVKYRLLKLVDASMDGSVKPDDDLSWHIYVTGHSLGGALATLFALELSTSKLAKDRPLEVTMYNYGSPRVGNKLFADSYNKIIKDSWRVVNHRDIVPTVPRLMGYCHVAQPIYLTAEETSMVLLDDGYKGDVIGEATPDAIIAKFMKGEQKILERLLDTEIAMLRGMRDGSAVMQHMEDFYYIALLQRVQSRIIASKIL